MDQLEGSRVQDLQPRVTGPPPVKSPGSFFAAGQSRSAPPTQRVQQGQQQQQQQQQQQPQQQRRQQQELVLPQDKVRKAILAADEGYEPSDYALNSQDPQTLIQEVEGPSLQSYQGREPFATEKTVNVNGESSLSVPIQVDVPGSIVSYVVEKRSADFSDFMFGIASRNVINEVEVVKDLEPFDTSVKNSGGSAGGRKTAKRMTDSLLVSAGSAPCTLQFQFENKNPFNVELSYSIRVLPPPDKETVVLGRKLRAQACVSLLEEELRELVPKQSAAESDVRRLEQEVESLESSVEEMSKTLRAVKEQEWRSKLEMEQQMEQQQQQS